MVPPSAFRVLTAVLTITHSVGTAGGGHSTADKQSVLTGTARVGAASTDWTTTDKQAVFADSDPTRSAPRDKIL